MPATEKANKGRGATPTKGVSQRKRENEDMPMDHFPVTLISSKNWKTTVSNADINEGLIKTTHPSSLRSNLIVY